MIHSWIVFALISTSLAAKVPEAAKQSKPLYDPSRSGPKGQQTLHCYDRASQTGNNVNFVDYAPDLRNFDFDNRISSCCFNGIFILFDDYNYNTGSTQSPAFFAWGENYCTNVPTNFDKRASSLRYVGAPDGFKYDTLNFYENEHYIGQEQYTYADAPYLNYDNLGRSVIVTGCKPWTLYEFNNYSGNCFCVYPSDRVNCYPGFYETSSSLGNLAGQVSSARRGCFCAKGGPPTNAKTNSHEGYFH